MQSKLCKFWQSSNVHYVSEILFCESPIISESDFIIFMAFLTLSRISETEKIVFA